MHLSHCKYVKAKRYYFLLKVYERVTFSIKRCYIKGTGLRARSGASLYKLFLSPPPPTPPCPASYRAARRAENSTQRTTVYLHLSSLLQNILLFFLHQQQHRAMHQTPHATKRSPALYGSLKKSLK